MAMDKHLYDLPRAFEMTVADIDRAWHDPDNGWHPYPHTSYTGASIQICRLTKGQMDMFVAVYIDGEQIGVDSLRQIPVDLLDTADPVTPETEEWWLEVMIRPRLETAMMSTLRYRDTVVSALSGVKHAAQAEATT